MKIKKDVSERVINGKNLIYYPEDKKLAIVKEIEEGKISLNKAKLLYGINSIKTLQYWLRKYSNEYKNNCMRSVFTDTDRRQIVYRILSGMQSRSSASKQYRVDEKTIRRWILLYGYNPETNIDMSKSSKQSGAEPKELKKIQKENDFLKLKVEALETMIDIAERELKIDIRKKSGTKQ